MEEANTISAIKNGETALGIELGSTRIKSVLINKDYEAIGDNSRFIIFVIILWF